jgi:hypothetical protein
MSRRSGSRTARSRTSVGRATATSSLRLVVLVALVVGCFFDVWWRRSLGFVEE